MNFKNKKILITGATGGIGNSLIKKFYEKDAIILATGTNEEKLNNLKKEFSNIIIEKFKLDAHGQIEGFIDTAFKLKGGLMKEKNNSTPNFSQ